MFSLKVFAMRLLLSEHDFFLRLKVDAPQAKIFLIETHPSKKCSEEHVESMEFY